MKHSKSIQFILFFCLVFFSCKQNPDMSTSGLESVSKKSQSKLESDNNVGIKSILEKYNFSILVFHYC